MHAPKSKPRTHRLSDLFVHTSRLAAWLSVGIVSLATMDFSAKASEKMEADRPSANSAETGEPEADVAKSAPEAQDDALGNYRLAPGDRISIVVFDEPQLSGELFVDGSGDVLLPLAGSVRLSGLTLAEAQELIRKQFANGVLVQPAVRRARPENHGKARGSNSSASSGLRTRGRSTSGDATIAGRREVGLGPKSFVVELGSNRAQSAARDLTPSGGDLAVTRRPTLSFTIS